MDTINSSDLAIFLTVLGLRLLVPLLIPRFPLPGVMAALVLDAADQTIFQTRTALQLDGYQAYDKALDVYYLTIAYLATLRNWTNPVAFRISRFLFYFRLVGVLLFEMTQTRALLLIFPNTFEYFFIFYELVQLRWDPRRLSKGLLLCTAAAIWILIKLPQEYWLHVAEMDMTDFIKLRVFGVPADTAWGELLVSQPVAPLLLLACLVLAGIALRFVLSRLPAADWGLAWNAARQGDRVTWAELERVRQRQAAHFLDWELFEKLLLVSLVTLIFARVVPGATTSRFGLEMGVILFIGVNTAISEWLIRRGILWTWTPLEFLARACANMIVFLGGAWLFTGQVDMQLGAPLLFVLLGTLLIVLYDRYQPIHQARFDSLAGAELRRDT